MLFTTREVAALLKLYRSETPSDEQSLKHLRAKGLVTNDNMLTERGMNVCENGEDGDEIDAAESSYQEDWGDSYLGNSDSYL